MLFARLLQPLAGQAASHMWRQAQHHSPRGNGKKSDGYAQHAQLGGSENIMVVGQVVRWGSTFTWSAVA